MKKLSFKNYPPSWIPLEFWVSEIRSAKNTYSKVVYLVVPTLMAFLKNRKQFSL